MRFILAVGLTVSAATASAADPAGRVVVPTCPGQGYVPYAYPAFGSCPCGEDRCFHPRPYYADCGEGDPAYKKAFWRRWLRAHFCGGSMLEGVPCHCLYPPGRAYTVPLSPAMPSTAPPAATDSSPADSREPPTPPHAPAPGLDAPTGTP